MRRGPPEGRATRARGGTTVIAVSGTGLDVSGVLLRSAPCRVVDVGGGTGVWAVPLASAGCEVLVVDPSPNSLAALVRRAVEAGVADRVHGVQGDVDSLGGPGRHPALPEHGADLVLAHGVLEVVDDVAAALAALRRLLAPGGTLSVLVACRAGTALQRAVAGRLAEARHVLADPDGRTGPADNLLRRFDEADLDAALRAAGLEVVAVRGDGVLTDLVPAAVRRSSTAAELVALEASATESPALAGVAGRLHALARLPAGG